MSTTQGLNAQSHEATTPQAGAYTPSAQDIESAGKVESWRIANGMWRTGAGEDGTAQKQSVVGLPIRFGITEEYTATDGKIVAPKFRIILKLAEGGTFSGQMRLDSTQARYLMGALTLWDGVSYISVTPNLSAKPNKHGKYTTYANVKQCEGPQKWVELRWSGGDQDWNALPDILQEELVEQHFDLYKDWVYEEEEAEAAEPWGELNKVLASHGYEEFTGQPEYVEFIRAGLKLPAWDANNCTDWKPVEALCEKHHAKLPAAFLDPFHDE